MSKVPLPSQVRLSSARELAASARPVGESAPTGSGASSRLVYSSDSSGEFTPSVRSPFEVLAQAAKSVELAHAAERDSAGESVVRARTAAPDSLAHPQRVRELQEGFATLSRPIVLIGPMAAGKTYIGSHLARFYGYEFLDADHVIVERYGEVSDIFEIFGEAHFRELEYRVIKEVLTSPAYRNTVFSLGGGAPMTDAVAQLLRDEQVVYILVDAATVEPRITGNKSRPLLQPDPVTRWQQIFDRRSARYEELAKFTLDARGGRSISEMTAEIQSFIVNSRKDSNEPA